MRQTDAYLPTDTHCAPMHTYLPILTVHRCTVITYWYSLCTDAQWLPTDTHCAMQWVSVDNHCASVHSGYLTILTAHRCVRVTICACAPMRTRTGAPMRTRTGAPMRTRNGAPMRAVHRCALRTDACCAPLQNWMHTAGRCWQHRR